MSNWYLKFRFNLKSRINLYEKLKAYTEEEFPIYDSLVKFKNRYDKKKDFRGLIIKEWLSNMEHGNSFSKAIKGWIPESELNLISAGEEGKGIEKGLYEAIRFAKSSEKIKKAIINNAQYPITLLLVISIFIAMFSVQIAPTYLKILPLEKWPDLGRYFYYVSSFLLNNWYIMIAILFGLSYATIKTLGTWVGPTREFFDKIPPWSIYKVYQGCSFLIGLTSMMQSGTPLNDALKKIKNVSSKWTSGYIEDMLKNLKRGGRNFGQHLNVGLLDEETSGDVIDYSELGKFEEAVYAIGEKNLIDSIEKIEKRMAIIKNVMIVFVGIVVGIVYYTSVQLNAEIAEYASMQGSQYQKKN